MQESAAGRFEGLLRALQAGDRQRAGVRRGPAQHLPEGPAEEEADRPAARQEDQHAGEVQEGVHAHRHPQEHQHGKFRFNCKV